MGPNKVRLLTNIPTPYRNHLYSHIHQASLDLGLDFGVWFTAYNRAANVLWEFEPSKIEYPHTFLGPENGRTNFRDQAKSTPSLIARLRKEKPTVTMVGGCLNLPSAIACLLARLNPGGSVFWCENHRPLNPGLIRNVGRKYIFRSFKNFVVPGILQKEYVLSLLSGRNGTYIHRMPNVVDENIFYKGVRTLRHRRSSLRRELGLTDSEKVFVSSMRLEPIKAADLLVKACAGLKSECRLIVAGDGSLKHPLEADDEVRNGRVLLLGKCTQERMTELLALADAFILPSRNDPYPLAVIEALWAGLPVLLSDAVGCHPEALEDGNNGFLCKANSISCLRTALSKLSQLDPFELRVMGERSLSMARRHFDSKKIAQSVASFFNRMCLERSMR